MKIKMFFLLFSVASIIILFTAHYLFYDYLVRFFDLHDLKFKITAGSILFVLPILFMLSMMLLHFYNNAAVSVLYYISGLWHGILVNFLIIIIASWFFVGVYKAFGHVPSHLTLQWIGIVGSLLALILSIYGVYNAYNLKIRDHVVKMENLPSEWKGKKAIQLSDIHLGSVLGKRYLNKINRYISEIKPDIILITGDMFDGTDKDLHAFIPELEKMSAPWGVFYATGNHDSYIGLDKVNDIVKKTGIRILNDEMAVINDVQIVGLSHPGEMEGKNITDTLKRIENFDPAKPMIVLFHEPKQIQEIKTAGADLMLSGHTHKGQMWPFGYITEQMYKGFDYGFFNWENFTLYVSSGAGVWGPTMRTGSYSEIVVFTFE